MCAVFWSDTVVLLCLVVIQVNPIHNELRSTCKLLRPTTTAGRVNATCFILVTVCQWRLPNSASVGSVCHFSFLENEVWLLVGTNQSLATGKGAEGNIRRRRTERTRTPNPLKHYTYPHRR
jgi:hypothetical protein